MQPIYVAVTVYVPDWLTADGLIVGFCREDAYPPGPAHEYVTPGTASVAVSSSVVPAHKGELLPGIGGGGDAGNVSTSGPGTTLEEHPRAVVTLIFV